MTKPNLDEKRDAQFRHYRERQHPGKECPMCSDLYHGWNAGWNAALSALREVGEAKDARIAELTEAIVFSLRGLQMWRTYQSPGNIAEVEQRLRQALKNLKGENDGRS